MTHPLSPLEHGIFNFDQAAIFNFFVMAKIQGQLPLEVLRQAIDKVQKRHYHLQVSIAIDRFEKPQFVFHGRTSLPLQQLTLSMAGRSRRKPIYLKPAAVEVSVSKLQHTRRPTTNYFPALTSRYYNG